MTRTDYALGMGDTRSELDYVNTKALERFARAFDHALKAKYGLGMSEPDNSKEVLMKLMVEARERRERLQQQQQKHFHVSIWHTFQPLKAIIHLRDNIRLRRYNREWIKNNIH